jgi:hypothetical protein
MKATYRPFRNIDESVQTRGQSSSDDGNVSDAEDGPGSDSDSESEAASPSPLEAVTFKNQD